MLEVLSSCIDDAQAIAQPLLDLILGMLLPKARKENPQGALSYFRCLLLFLLGQLTDPCSGSRLAQSLISRCEKSFANPILQFLSDVISGGGRSVDSELKESAYDLILELSKVRN